MDHNKVLALGMKRALDAMKRCDGDLDFAIFIKTVHLTKGASEVNNAS